MGVLAKYWRYWFRNDTDAPMDYDLGGRIAIRSMPWKISSGDLNYGTVVTHNTQFTAGETVAAGSSRIASAVNNSSDLYQGVNGTFEITHDQPGASGTCLLFLEFSDNNGNWPSESSDHDIDDLIKISILPIDNSGEDKSRSVNFSFPL